MYPANIIDHSANLRNRGILDPADAEWEGEHRLCGDRLRLTLRLDENNRITALAWDSQSCAITDASASMLGEEIIGMTVDDVLRIDREHIFDLLGIELPKNRVPCALLSLKVLTIALHGPQAWQSREIENED
jgi:nitrogen fixation NifU-like protein